MLVTGRTPGVFSVATGWRVVVLFAVLQACDLFRQRFFLDPGRERGLHWRAGLLRLAKWPHVLLALRDALAGPNRGYLLTSKVSAGPKRYAAAPAHLIVAALVGTAWAVGTARGVIHNQVLDVAAGFVVALSLLVAVSELRRFPPPYDDELASRELASA